MIVIFWIFFEKSLFSFDISIKMKYRRPPTIYPLQTQVFLYGIVFSIFLKQVQFIWHIS